MKRPTVGRRCEHCGKLGVGTSYVTAYRGHYLHRKCVRPFFEKEEADKLNDGAPGCAIMQRRNQK